MIVAGILKSTSFLLTLGGVILLFFAIWLNWTQVHENSYNVFWGMLGNNLSTTSVSKTVNESGSNGDVVQNVSMNYGLHNDVYISTLIKSANATVKTAGIGTTDTNYQKYVSVKATPGSTAKLPDFTQSIGKWVKQATGGSSGQPSLFSQVALGLEGGNVLPMASLTSDQRVKLLDYLHSNTVFQTDYSKVQKHSENGRPVYTYNVTVEPVAYVGLEKQFAEYLNIKDLDKVDPNNYESSKPLNLKLSVDAHSQRLVKTDYVGAKHTEEFSDYGILHKISVPVLKSL